MSPARTRLRRLPTLPEPARTRTNLRRAAGEDPDGAHDLIARRLTELAWAAWREELVPAGLRRRDLAQIVRADRHETWLWVMGERTWTDLAAGLAGRVLRRLP